MIFPFSVHFSGRLPVKLESHDFPNVLKVIEASIKEKNGNIIYRGDDELTYKGTSSWWNLNIFQTVDKGTFKIKKTETFVLGYKISFLKHFSFALILALLSFAYTQEIYVGLFSFAVLGGLNWITSIIRHKSLLTEITAEIEYRYEKEGQPIIE